MSIDLTSRRHFLKNVGIGSMAVGLTACSSVPFGKKLSATNTPILPSVSPQATAQLITGDVIQGRIDVHHHLIPPVYQQNLAKYGIKDVAGKKLPHWLPQDSINIMNQIGTQTAILSLSAPGVYFGNLPEAQSLARACNEYAATIKQQFPKRFGNFAVLPMPFTESCCQEAIYALDTLKAEGIVLLGSTEGVFLGDSRLNELMAELDKRHAVVFIHPNLHPTTKELNSSLPGFVLEFLPDTTRAAMNLIMSGTLDRYPNIRWILAHAGGFLPYVAWRMSLENLMPKETMKLSKGVLAYIKSFYYDTALSPSSYAMGALKDLVGTQHILFGSDFPFAPAPISKVEAKSLDELPVFHGEQYALQRGNALSLFPQFANTPEINSQTPLFYQESPLNHLKRAFSDPEVALVEKLRDR